MTKTTHPDPATVHSRHPVTVTVEFDHGWPHVGLAVECLDAHLGAKRPCAIWADEEGYERRDECTYEQYAEDADVEEWITGGKISVIGYLFGTGGGEDFGAAVSPVPMRVENGASDA